MDITIVNGLLEKGERKRTDLRMVPYLELRTLLDDIKDALDEVEALGERLARAQERVEEIVEDMEEAESDYAFDFEDEEAEEESDEEEK